MDNDRGNQSTTNSAMWMGTDCFRGYQNPDVDVLEETGYMTVICTYRLSVVPETITEVKYVVTPDGYIGAKCYYHGQPGLPELPLSGMWFRFLKAVGAFSWYDQGPGESYVDRYDEARFGIYGGAPTGSMSRYLLPQECGNHMSVKWPELYNRNGGRLKFAAVNTSFEMSVLPYTAEKLKNAQHMEELPVPRYIIVNILARQRGVGGGDSWGVPVYPEYCISGERDVEFSFVTECVQRVEWRSRTGGNRIVGMAPWRRVETSETPPFLEKFLDFLR